MEKHVINFKAGDAFTGDDLDNIGGQFPTSSRMVNTIFESVEESYVTNDVEVIIKIKGKQRLDKNDLSLKEADKSAKRRNPLLSDCCESEVEDELEDDTGTLSYFCKKCGEPCGTHIN